MIPYYFSYAWLWLTHSTFYRSNRATRVAYMGSWRYLK